MACSQCQNQSKDRYLKKDWRQTGTCCCPSWSCPEMHINKISIYTHLITDTGTLFNNSSLCLKMTACALNHLVFSLCFHHIFNASTLNFSVVCPKELIGNNLPFTDRCSSSRIIFNVKFVNVPKTVYHMYFD